MTKYGSGKIVGEVARRTAVAGISLLALAPFYVLLIFALSRPDFLSGRTVLRPQFYLGNITQAWYSSGMGISIVNSLVITGGALALTVALAGMAGYAIARFANRFHQLVFGTFMFCMMIPPIINTVPLYTLMRAIGGINTRWAMILVCTANALPFSVFLYTSFIRTMPQELEEAAIIDGCSWFSAFWRVTLPIMKPATAAVIIINGLGIWNNYAQAVFFLQNKDVRTIPLAISMFFQQYGAKWHLMAAAALVGMAPVVTAFLFFQKYFIKGIASGALKG